MHELRVPLALDHPPVDGVPHEHLAVLRRAHHDVAVLAGRGLGHALDWRRVGHEDVAGGRDPLPVGAVVDVPHDDLLGRDVSYQDVVQGSFYFRSL